jgi:hypothetical protein
MTDPNETNMINPFDEIDRLEKEIKLLTEQIEMLKKDTTLNELELITQLHREINRLKRYEALVKFIATDYVELSYEKAKNEYLFIVNRCRKLVEEDEEGLTNRQAAREVVDEYLSGVANTGFLYTGTPVEEDEEGCDGLAMPFYNKPVRDDF